MQHRHMNKMITDLIRNKLPVAMIMLLYFSIYYANVDHLVS
ncbi:MAG: hypothetical protein Q9M12_07970 [Mariprofundus sp.]|nr:hypothetical protein [Mariprofundus sp.]